MKRIFFILIGIGCLFTLSQCDKIENQDNEISPIPIEPWDYSKVAFIARITDNSADWSLCIMDKSGGGVRKIFDKPVACQKPIRSHSGTKLLFISKKFDTWINKDNSVGMSLEYELYIINTEGAGLTLIDRIGTTETGSFGSVAWSPDESQVIYVKYTDAYWENCNLILYNISDNTHKTLQIKGNVSCPEFSPDGQQIVYCASNETGHHIYKMNVNGNNSQLLIKNASSPKWSPQGDKIVYLTSGIDRSSQISVAKADGSGQKTLTSSVSSGLWDSGFPRDGNEDPQWTIDGQKIVYVSWVNGKPEIFIMNADGTNPLQLTTAEYSDENPEITPDGQYILFSSRRSDMMNNGIVIMSLDGSNQKVFSNVGIWPVACK